MPFNYPLENVREMLLAQNLENIYIDNIVEDPEKNISVQSAIFLIPETSTPTLTNLQTLDFSCYVRNSNIDTAFEQSWQIWHYLHNKRGNFNTVANNYLKITLIEGITSPYQFSTTSTGANFNEYITRLRIHYIDTNFDNF